VRLQAWLFERRNLLYTACHNQFSRPATSTFCSKNGWAMIAVRVLIAVTAVALLFLSISPATTFVHAAPRNTTLYNDRPRFDVDGQYVDAHDGMILAHTFPNASTVYFLYGEFYNTTRGGAFPWGRYPQMSVYTSEDMSTWSYRGQAVDESYSSSSKWIPNVIYDKQLKRFVMWFGCGQWCVATSEDGLVFSNVTLQYSRYGDSDSTDGAQPRPLRV
jgi:hypothetical protein